MRKLQVLYWMVFALSIAYCYETYAQQTYVLSPESEVKISGTSSISDWTVTGRDIGGKLRFNQVKSKDKNARNPIGVIAEAEAILKVESIKSEKGEAMDNKMYNALKREEHPIIRFVLTKPVDIGRQPSDSVTAVGSMTIAGVTKDFSLKMAARYINNEWLFAGNKKLKMSDYHIDPPSAMFGQIVAGDEIQVDMALVYQLGEHK